MFSGRTYQSLEVAFLCRGKGSNWLARKISENPSSHVPNPIFVHGAGDTTLPALIWTCQLGYGLQTVHGYVGTRTQQLVAPARSVAWARVE